jgi:Domain of unknown function (DUF6794)
MTHEEFIAKVKTSIDKIIRKEDKALLSLSTRDGVEEHHFMGQWLRNNWHLWGDGNEWVDFFNENDIWHADDMSGIIMATYVRQLRNEEVRLDEQFKYYKDYWKKQRIDIKRETLEARAKSKAAQKVQ